MEEQHNEVFYALYSKKAVMEGTSSTAIYESLDRPGEEVEVTNVFTSKELLLKYITKDDKNVGRIGRWLRAGKQQTIAEWKRVYWNDELQYSSKLELWPEPHYWGIIGASTTNKTQHNNEQ